MFYVFGINGPMYQGSHERLSQIASVRSAQRPAGLRSNAGDVESREAQARQAAVQQKEPDQPSPTYGRPAAQRVAAAYQGTKEGPKEQRQPLKTVADVMTHGALTISPRSTVEEAWSILSRHKVGQMPVLGDDGRVLGLLLRADIAPPSLSNSLAPALAQRRVNEVMLTPVPAVAKDTLLRRLAYVLLDTGLPGLPVVEDGGEVVGFVSRTDILRAVAADPPLDLWG